MKLLDWIKGRKKKQPIQVDLLEKSNRPEPVITDELYFHEDFYLQIEILPFENKELLISESSTIENFAKEHFDGQGFTDIYERKGNKYPTINKAINSGQIQELLENVGLKKLNRIKTGYSSYVENASGTFGFGNSNFGILMEAENNIVKNIFVLTYRLTSDDKELLVKGLKSIGDNFQMLLIDWEMSRLVDLTNRMDIENYINE